MASRRRSAGNALLTALVIGRTPLRKRMRTAVLLRSHRLMVASIVWRVARRVAVGRPEPVRVVKTRSVTVETE